MSEDELKQARAKLDLRTLLARLGPIPHDGGECDPDEYVTELVNWAYAAQDVIARLLMKIEEHQ